jgi:hypothetical protein
MRFCCLLALRAAKLPHVGKTGPPSSKWTLVLSGLVTAIGGKDWAQLAQSRRGLGSPAETVRDQYAGNEACISVTYRSGNL